MLCHATFFAEGAIPRPWLQRAIGEKSARRFSGALLYLRRHGLLELRPSGVCLPPALARAVRRRLNPAKRRRYAERVVACVIEVFPWPGKSGEDYTRVRPHAEACARWVRRLDLGSPSAAWMLGTLTTLYHREGRLAEAAALMEHDLALCERALGRESAELESVLHNLVLIYLDQGRLDEAEAQFWRGIRLVERAPGPLLPGLWAHWLGLARVYALRSDREAAETLTARARAMRPSRQPAPLIEYGEPGP